MFVFLKAELIGLWIHIFAYWQIERQRASEILVQRHLLCQQSFGIRM